MNLRAVSYSLCILLSCGLISGCAGNQSGITPQTAAVGENSSELLAPDACSWKMETSPDPSTTNSLSGVSGSSASNVWAVGYYYSNTTPLQTLAIEWNGKSWSQVMTPNPSSYGNALLAVAAISATDAWAVGEQNTASTNQPLALHWNGKAWATFKLPAFKGGSARLYSISAASSTNIWAIGGASPVNGKGQPYVVHWNGKTWQVVTVADPGTYGSSLGAVAAHASNDAWVTGGTYTNSGLTSFVTLAEHWNGSKWTVVQTPNANNSDNVFNAAVDLGSTDAWAIGDYYTGSAFATLTEHWDGTKWSIVKSPNAKNLGNGLSGATASSSSDVWAVGTSFGGSEQTTLSLHWNGTVWSIVKSPNLNAPDAFNAVSSVAKSKTVWAVGGSFGSGSQTLTAQTACDE